MLPTLRRLAARIALVAMALIAAPAVTTECRLFAADEGMPCCKRTQPAPATLDGDCCTLAPSAPTPTQVPSAPTTSAPSMKAPIVTAVVIAAVIVPTSQAQPSSVSTVSPPLERLSLNLSAIRR
jgi:hypothetical protein